MFGVGLTNPSWAGNLLRQQFDDITFAEEEDIDTVRLSLTVSGSDAGPYSDADTVSVLITPSGLDAGPYVDSATVVLLFSVSGSDTFTPLAPYTPVLDDFNRADGGLGANWDTWWAFSAGSIVGNKFESTTASPGGYWNPTTFGDYQDCYIDYVSGTYPSIILGVMIQSNAGVNGYLGVVSFVSGTQFSYGIYVDFAPQVTGNVDYGATVTRWWLRAGGGVITLYAFANSVWNFVDSYADATYVSGNLAFVADTPSSTAYLDNFGGGGAQERVDSDTIYLDLQPASAEEMHGTLIDSTEVYLSLIGTAVEESPYNEAAVVLLTLTPITTFEDYGKLDDAVVYLDIQPSGIETPSWDIATVYVTMTPLGGECFSRFHWTCEGEAEPEWGTESDLTCWSETSVLPRWTCTIDVQPGCN
jgi:hypothetical protein